MKEIKLESNLLEAKAVLKCLLRKKMLSNFTSNTGVFKEPPAFFHKNDNESSDGFLFSPDFLGFDG